MASPVTAPTASYPLTRSYTIASLAGIVAVTALLAMFYRHNAVEQLRATETDANAAVASVLANAVWPEFGGFIASAGRLPPEQLRSHPATLRLGRALTHKLRGLRVAKIKIYDPDGVTVFSTEAGQIGDSKADNPGFQSALGGRMVSDITHRDRFNAYDRIIEDRSLLFSYVPVRVGNADPVVAVFEVYSDLTPLLQTIRRTELTVVLVVVALMLVLFLFLLFIVRRADRLIRVHEQRERDSQQERIRHLAEHDHLTGLPNRGMLLKLLGNGIRRSRHTGTDLALVLLDIDRFKLINDHFGQNGGDRLLLDVVSRIAEVAGRQRILARVGGDEFVVLLDNPGQDSVETLVRELVKVVSTPYRVGDGEIKATVSVGVALLQEDVADAVQLLKNAEAAMLQAKSLGRNRYSFFTEELDQRAASRFALEAGLHHALTKEEFHLVFQPRLDAAGGRVVGAEALLRWQPPEAESVGPAEFVPVLEEMGLIIPVGAWVLEQACKQCAHWHEQGFDELTVSVNLSMRQFCSESLLGEVIQALMESGLPAASLELELTESILAEDSSQALVVMRALKELGVMLSIDDFGTGYSSLGYLLHYPVDYLKIDRAFVRDATTNPDHANLTRTIVSMADSLGLKTVAEGVEAADQHAFLAGLGCDQLQGYLFSRPLPAQDFLDYLVVHSAGSAGRVLRGGGS